MVALLPAIYSYVTTMMQPSSVSLSIRSVEWLRAHHGAWFVNDVERIYYSWNAPSKGGPSLHALPRVGSSVPRALSSATSAYQPRRLRPILRPALPSEGVWRSTGRLVSGAPPVLVTTFRSEPAFPRIVAYVAWFDRTRTQLALYPGRYEPPAASPRGPMEVPTGQRTRLLATFNSGFTNRDGHGGFAVNGRAAAPLLAGQGTVVAYRDGRVDVIDWRGGATPGPAIVLARQNLPLIVTHGKPSPLLTDTSAWGTTLGNAIRVWRSAVGVDRHGNLIYAAASDQTVGTLAAIMIHAGAVRAIELDINAEWPSLNTYGPHGTRDPAKVVPNDQQSASRYLRPDDRDFFAVYGRLGGGTGVVPFH
jgi:Phosphodiester glycosidase